MSGPKCSGYTVETAQAREARAYAAALAAYERTRAALARLRTEALALQAVFGNGVPVVAGLPPGVRAGRTSVDLVEAERAATARLGRAEDELRRITAELGRERWLADAPPVVRDLRTVVSAEAQLRRKVAAQPDGWRSTHVADLAEIARAWPLGQPKDVLDAATATVAIAAGSSAAALAVARARDRLASLRSAERARVDRSAELDRLRAEVESVRQWQDDTTTRTLLARIDEAATAFPQELPAQVQAYVAAAHARRDRDEASTILADVLTEMGYQLGGSFTTRLHGPTEVLVGRPGWNDHAVSVRLDDAGRVHTHAVRAADADTGADARVDAEFCSDFDAMVARAGRRGLGLAPVRRFAAGERPLRAVDGTRVRQVSSGRSRPVTRQREA
ncbi:hypothetical protein [Pseudonocardia sp. 73-21]|uniref:hypothetical protein n=1 Tax=Pseudonocardia sp. 73-21 TaxID=1895809 RepID=UPI000966C024|nr:hypothetical protein [Pseudonocardia sp. 73-21]OJY45937.1 MAG: hypothetical protein BGP03_31220 [Pseudonocardia sp. 73-21]